MRSMIYFLIMLANLSFKALTTPRSMLNCVIGFCQLPSIHTQPPLFLCKVLQCDLKEKIEMENSIMYSLLFQKKIKIVLPRFNQDFSLRANCFANFSLRNLLQFNPKTLLGYSLVILNQRMEIKMKKSLHLTIKLTPIPTWNTKWQYKVS